MTEPVFFADAAAFCGWLATHAASATELLVGYHRVATGKACMSWAQSVDEALCVGWIDGRRKRIDEHSYTIRFTPRLPHSIWSAVNIANIDRLRAAGRMQPAGEQAYALRSAARSGIYAHEQSTSAELAPDELARFQQDSGAWAFFCATPPSYKKRLLHWVCSAKKSQTRATRLAALRDACRAGLRMT